MTPREIHREFIAAGEPAGFRPSPDIYRSSSDFDLNLRRRTGTGVVDFWAVFDGRGRHLKEIFVVDELNYRHDAPSATVEGGLTLLKEHA